MEISPARALKSPWAGLDGTTMLHVSIGTPVLMLADAVTWAIVSVHGALLLG